MTIDVSLMFKDKSIDIKIKIQRLTTRFISRN